MQFMIYCLDKPGHAHVRADNRAAHLDYLKSGWISKVIVAGPLLTEDGNTMIGSLLTMELVDRAEAERFCADDPYNKAGLFASVTVRPWKKVLP
ncbi:MAG: YciI family protein [Dongiaceae bacterium]